MRRTCRRTSTRLPRGEASPRSRTASPSSTAPRTTRRSSSSRRCTTRSTRGAGSKRMSDERRPSPEVPAPADSPPFRDFLRYFLGLGTWGFGGPIATVGYMQRDLVEKRKWLSEREFLNGVALGQTMPGPLAAQVVMWVGFIREGSMGALATAAAFILPSFILVLAVAAAYVPNQGLSAVQAL